MLTGERHFPRTTAMATSQLFRRKKIVVSAIRGQRISLRGTTLLRKGPVPVSRKKVVAATQIDNADAATLNTARCKDRLSRIAQKAMTRVSRTTVTVPDATPKSRTDAKTNVSETVRRAVIDGTFTVKEPVRTVRAARINHSGRIGFARTAANECTTAASPTVTTARM